MPKWLKFMIALLLLPACIGAGQALWRVLTISVSADMVLVPFLAGVACWLVIFAMLPKPMLIYVFGHELTHAIWVWIFGGKVKKFKVTSKGGYVIISKNNFLIGLSPYFFPVYAVIVLLIFGIGHVIWEWSAYLPVLLLGLGFAYAFHVTLTSHVLQMRQTDITQQGYLFSAVVIFLGNVLVLLIGLPLMMAKVTLLTSLGLWLRYSGDAYIRLGSLL